ncbi:restriction endonuclease subunit S [Weissella confusa]|uniref:restriction endonuclease subunit S n=1 Tax=Weissella confusa TaxID=1583 RepID=UPI002A756DD5|nr:restriction endonuclease subunit S [Weissella confusa]MDY2513161.1 restriction endonuclease subunit S [Weissella confusa]
MSNKVPQIRFNGYSDAWEERKLNEVAIFYNGQRIPIDSSLRKQGEYPYYGATGIIDYVEDYIFDGEFVLLAEDGANITMRNSPIAYLTQGKFWLNNHAHIMAMKDGSNNFLVQLLEKQNYEKYNSGTAQPKLNSQVVKSLNFLFPTKEEQKKIGSFFKQLDNTIALHQRKLDLLKEQKKGYLQKMFPKNGEKVPELRFAGFADDWEERKLRDLLNKNSEKNKNLSVINVESVSNKTGFTKQTDQFEDYSVASADLSNYYVIREKQFAYNPSRINVGSIAYKDLGDEISVVSPLYVSFSTKKVLNDGFLWNWFKTASFDAQRQRLSEGGVRDTLSFNQLSEMNTMFPTYPEQEKIGSFFKQLDNTIALHQRKLDLLKEQKKGFLQKMFV